MSSTPVIVIPIKTSGVIGSSTLCALLATEFGLTHKTVVVDANIGHSPLSELFPTPSGPVKDGDIQEFGRFSYVSIGAGQGAELRFQDLVNLTRFLAAQYECIIYDLDDLKLVALLSKWIRTHLVIQSALTSLSATSRVTLSSLFEPSICLDVLTRLSYRGIGRRLKVREFEQLANVQCVGSLVHDQKLALDIELDQGPILGPTSKNHKLIKHLVASILERHAYISV